MPSSNSCEDPYFQDFLQLSFDVCLDAIGLLDPDGTIIHLNASGAAAFGSSDGGPERGNWIELWERGSRSDIRAALKKASGAATASVTSSRATGPGGRQVWETIIAPVIGTDGVAARLLVRSRNVTAERDAHQALKKSAEIHSALIDATSEIVWHFDVGSGISDRRGWWAFTGQADDAYDADSWLQFVHPEDRDRADELTRKAFLERKPLLIEYRMRHHSGEWRWVEDHATPLLDENGEISDWVGIISDIHDRRSAEEALRSSEERLRLAVEATGLACWEYDAQTGRQVWSTEMLDMFQLPPHCIASHATYLDRVHPEDRERVDREFQSAVVSVADFGASTFRICLPAGEVRWIEGRSRIFRNEAGSIVRHIGTLRDITLRKQAEHEIWKAAYHDGLTGLANRALFHAKLDEAIRPPLRKDAPVCIISVDLDNFKDVNDNLGHDAGDVLLRVTAERLTSTCPVNATVARFGGDEFGIVVPFDPANPTMRDLTEACLQAVRQPVLHDGKAFRCTVSLGWTLFPDQGSNASTLLKNADLALYAAKAAGRNKATCFDPAMRVEALRRLTVLQKATDALARDAVVPFYQPKVSLENGTVVGFEALLRWTDERGLRGPGEIVEAFDDPDLAMRLGTRMLELVAEDMQRWRAAALPFGHVAVNVGLPEFHRDDHGRDLCDRVLRELDARDLPSSSLHIEITERVLLDEDADIIAPTLFRLQDAGIRIALDDFGTGYASLTHLQKYPVSFLKIDRSFVGQMQDDRNAAAIVRAVAGLAHGLNIVPIAEGAETAEQVEMLRKMDCDIVQGFYFGQPIHAARVPHLLAGQAGADHRPPVRASASPIG